MTGASREITAAGRRDDCRGRNLRLAQGGYWVVGNRVQSFDDANLARSNILQCSALEQPPRKDAG